MLADPHPDENKRLETLYDYDILDTDREREFDDVVALAAQICEAPVSLISLVDADRQWFKATQGHDASETALDQAICAHAILETEFLEIPDLTKDPRTRDNPLVTADPFARFYAGANLIAPNGLPIGTLCVLDTQPRKLNDFQCEALKTLARQIVRQMELQKRLKNEIVLRDEIDHRVRNSLQTIASVLRLSARQITDPVAVEVLAMVERRLGAVASLHSELMGNGNDGSVDAEAYLERVGQVLDDMAPDNIQIIFDSAPLQLEANKASAIGMIVSEFVANAIKHAFPDGRAGKVTIRLHRKQGRSVELTCRDDGIGDAAQQSPSDRKDQGLGETIMASAATQLGCEIKSSRGPEGTAISATFMT